MKKNNGASLVTRFCRFALICVAGYFCALFLIYHLNARFSISHIYTHKNELIPPIHSEPINRDVLSQKFTYLSHGSQMYVFESEDKKYVLKLIKHNRYRSLFSKHAEKQQKLKQLYESCFIAATELKTECGLEFIHFHNQDCGKIPLTLVDKLNRTYKIDLAHVDFIVQKKCLLSGMVLDDLIQADKVDEAKRRIDQIMQLLNTRFKKGIDDSDCVVEKNIGFLEDTAVFLDIGQFSKPENAAERAPVEKKHAILNFQQSLSSCQELSNYLMQQIR